MSNELKTGINSLFNKLQSIKAISKLFRSTLRE